jgi:hypothetical protein
MIGACGLTVIISEVLDVPCALVALIVKVAVANVTVGVPEIVPVLVSNDKPVGRVPLVMAKLAAAPPILVGVAGVIVDPTV